MQIMEQFAFRFFTAMNNKVAYKQLKWCYYYSEGLGRVHLTSLAAAFDDSKIFGDIQHTVVQQTAFFAANLLFR